MAEIKMVLEDEENNRIEVEASRLGLTKTAFLKLLFKGWMGEVRVERTSPDGENHNEENKT